MSDQQRHGHSPRPSEGERVRTDALPSGAGWGHPSEHERAASGRAHRAPER